MRATTRAPRKSCPQDASSDTRRALHTTAVRRGLKATLRAQDDDTAETASPAALTPRRLRRTTGTALRRKNAREKNVSDGRATEERYRARRGNDEQRRQRHGLPPQTVERTDDTERHGHGYGVTLYSGYSTPTQPPVSFDQ